MAYNLTNLTAANNILEYIQAVNALTGNVAMLVVVSILYLLVFASLSVRWGASTAFMVAGFVGFVTSIMLFFSGLLPESAAYISFFVLILSVGLKVFFD